MTQNRYTATAILLHWMTAALVIFQILLGLRMGAAHPSSLAFALFQLHKSVGFLILFLTLVRIGWRIAHPPPPLPEGISVLEARLARLAHFFFYVLLLALPLTGWAVISASRIHVPTFLFGIVPWPHLPFLPALPDAQRVLWHDAAASGHVFLFLILAALLILHIGGALRHQRDKAAAVIPRMLPHAWAGSGGGTLKDIRLWLIFFLLAAAAAAALLIQPTATPGPRPAPAAQKTAPASTTTASPSATTSMTAASPAIPPSSPSAMPVTPPRASENQSTPPLWHVDPASSLAFAVLWGDTPIAGAFRHFTADIRFDPDRPETGRIAVRIGMVSAETGDAQRDAMLREKDWFDTDRYPAARYTATRIRKTGKDAYTAEGRLTLKGISRPVPLAFKLKLDGMKAYATGEAVIARSDFGIGQDDAVPEMKDLPDKVSVKVSISATRTGTRKLHPSF